MAKLRYKDVSGAGVELELKPGVNTLGRNPSNQFVIDDPSVSGSHCEIHVVGSSVRVKDLGSTNGTRLNGGPIQEAALQPGQTIQFGGVEMVCEDGARAASPGASAAKPRLTVGRSTQTAHLAAPAAASSVPSAPSSTPSISGAGALMGLGMDRAQLESQARAKMYWGESTTSVISYLRSYGFSKEDATAITDALLVERAASVRKSGVLKTVLGLVLIPVPVATFLISNSVGFFDVKIFGASVLVGAIGLWKLIDGLVMLFFPKSHQGDLSED